MNEIDLILNDAANMWISFFIDEDGHGPAWILIFSFCTIGPVAAFVSVSDDYETHPIIAGSVWVVWGCLGAVILWVGGLILPFLACGVAIIAGGGALIRLLVSASSVLFKKPQHLTRGS